MKLLHVLLCAFTATAVSVAQQPAPKNFPPDESALKKLKDSTDALRAKVKELEKDSDPYLRADVEVFLKAGDWMLRHNEWFAEKTAEQTQQVLDAGLARAKALADKKPTWLATRGKPIALAYRSRIDDSLQPYSLLFPANYNAKKKYRLDVVLHGRDATLTEVRFLHGKETAKGGNAPDHFELQVYGRGNNAYRWAGETDVFEAIADAVIRTGGEASPLDSSIELQQVVLRGFSMGGAGTWHIGLHYPTKWAVIGPGAGFTTTKGYAGGLPKELPGYVEKCLRIYDAVDYAENAFNVPVVAYSGGKDPQKKAADNIEEALKMFKEPHTFTHIIAPEEPHRLPPEWFKKCDEEYRKHVGKKQEMPERVRFVTYTTQYSKATWVEVAGLEKQYEKATVDATWNKDGIKITTTNVRRVFLEQPSIAFPEKITIDGQAVKALENHEALFEKTDGKWAAVALEKWLVSSAKKPGLQGPIDDAFRRPFFVVNGEGKAWNAEAAASAGARGTDFGKQWDKYFRGKLFTLTADKALSLRNPENIVLFGDPGSNKMIEKLLPKLPIKWTKDDLEVNGVKYDAKTHFPVFIYPNPENPMRYVVINSGHTFGEADLKGTNALLFPKLGDWAVLKLAPTKDNPHATEVVAAGLFDEDWKFGKK